MHSAGKVTVDTPVIGFIRVPNKALIGDSIIGEVLINVASIRHVQSGPDWTSFCVGEKEFYTTTLPFDTVCQLIFNAGGNIRSEEH